MSAAVVIGELFRRKISDNICRLFFYFNKLSLIKNVYM